MRPYVIIHFIFYISILKKLEIVSNDQFEQSSFDFFYYYWL